VTFRVVALRDQCRAQVERLIRTIYWERFTAQPGLLPQTLVADVCGAGTVECAAGIRYSNHGFFSEWYLNQPVEVALRFRTGRIADRTRVIEVCNLVARRPGSSLPFVRSIIEFAEAADVDWAIFTATNPLRALLARSGLKMVELVRASRRAGARCISQCVNSSPSFPNTARRRPTDRPSSRQDAAIRTGIC
jgi:hypothetical protein